jgi:hypothetical protein
MISTTRIEECSTYMYHGSLGNTKRLKTLIRKNNHRTIDKNIYVENDVVSFYIVSDDFVKNSDSHLVDMLEKSIFHTKSIITINSYSEILKIHDKKFSMRIFVKNDKINLIVRSGLPEQLHTILLFKLLNNKNIIFSKKSYEIIDSFSDTSIFYESDNDSVVSSADTDTDLTLHVTKKQKTY